MKNRVGRPLKWNSPEELQNEINGYFKKTPEDKITITGLVLYLNTSKRLLLNYQEKKEYKEIIEMAKLRVENAYEVDLRKKGRSGDIFALKNFGWTDKQEMDLNLFDLLAKEKGGKQY